MQYDESIVIPWKKRRSNFVDYLQEIAKPSSTERQLLLQDFLDMLYSLRPKLIIQLQKDYQVDELDSKLSETYKKSEVYYKILDLLLRYLRVGYIENDTEDKAITYIDKELANTNIPNTLISDLKYEFIKVWKTNKIGFMYFGDIAEKFDGFMYLRMAETITNKKISKGEAIAFLIDKFLSNSTSYVVLKYYLIMNDISWAITDLIESSPSNNDKVSVGKNKIVFNRTRSDQVIITRALNIYSGDEKIADYSIVTRDEIYPLTLHGRAVSHESHNLEELSEFLSLLTIFYNYLNKKS